MPAAPASPSEHERHVPEILLYTVSYADPFPSVTQPAQSAMCVPSLDLPVLDSGQLEGFYLALHSWLYLPLALLTSAAVTSINYVFSDPLHIARPVDQL